MYAYETTCPRSIVGMPSGQALPGYPIVVLRTIRMRSQGLGGFSGVVAYTALLRLLSTYNLV